MSRPSKAWCRGSYLPGPQVLNSAFVASSNAGDSATIAPTFRSVFAHPSSRFPIPGANESSTDEAQPQSSFPCSWLSPQYKSRQPRKGDGAPAG